MGHTFALLMIQALAFIFEMPGTQATECRNTHGDDDACDQWASGGQCEGAEWMMDNCEMACGLCFLDENEDEKFQRLLQEFNDFRLREFPEYATFVGYHRYDDALESFTLEAFERRKNKTEKFLKKLQYIDTRKLSRLNQRETRIFTSCLKTFVDGYRWREYGALNSINFLEGLSKGPQWPYYFRFDTEQDFEAYLKRLTSFPRQIDDQIMLMRRAIMLKRTDYIVSIDRVPKMLDEWNADVSFLIPFQRALSGKHFPPALKNQMLEKSLSIIPQVNNALDRLKKFISQEYLEGTRRHPGVHSLPQGTEYYQACLKWYLGYDVTAEEVFDLGVKEVARIEKNINEVMSSVGFVGNLREFFRHVQTMPAFYNHTKHQILQKYRSLLDEDIIPRLDEIFYNVTISPVKVVAVERDGPWGSYGLSSFYVNLKEPHKRSTFTMMPLTLHEAYPGHHFQDLYSQQFDIPLYRSQPIYGRLYSVPFHFPVYSAYAEGWALYAEYLGHELGLYHEPYQLFGRYVSEIFRACRLVVDTGIHAYGWSRERAISFLSNYSDFPLSQITAEVDRYITAPGQGCAYKIGELKIKSIREKASRSLGRLFDVREFHDQILKTGFVPLDILDEVVEDWIKDKLTSEPTVTSASLKDNMDTNAGKPFDSSITKIVCVLTLFYLRLVSR